MLYTTNRHEKSFCGIIEYDDTRLLVAPMHQDTDKRWNQDAEADEAVRPGYEQDPDDEDEDWQEADEEADDEVESVE